MASASDLSDLVRRHAHALETDPSSLDPLLDTIGDASIVLLGEGTHGTAEFHQIREQITRRLIREKGFSFIAVEGDWPDAYRVNEYIRGGPGTARDALAGFERFVNWFRARLPEQFDAYILVGETHAVQPLELMVRVAA